MIISGPSWTSTFSGFNLYSKGETSANPLTKMQERIGSLEVEGRRNEAMYWARFDKEHFSASATNRAPDKQTPSGPPPFDIDAEIDRVVSNSSEYLEYKISMIFEEDKERILSGNTGQDYKSHIDNLTKAIENEDYAAVKNTLKSFYAGDSDQIITRMKETVADVEEKFWSDIDKALGQMRQTQGLSISDGIREQNGITGLDLVDMAIKKARSKFNSLTEMDFGSIIDSAKDGAAEYAAAQMKDPGQRNTRELAERITESATVYAKHFILNSTENTDRFADQEQNVTDEINSRKHSEHPRHVLGENIDEQLSRSSGVGMFEESELSREFSKRGKAVAGELKSLLDRSVKQDSTAAVEEFTEQELSVAAPDLPADFAGNDNWKAYRTDMTSVMSFAIIAYSDKYNSARQSARSGTESGASLNYRV
ncbi:hypothetical protein [Maridesulfovibrio sp. FT414]|uniref:hypothetical protein n=1 Tax=Maridesulfovibrio sp. FT414 TaxID=2979469 RepID=UPI003D805408